MYANDSIFINRTITYFMYFFQIKTKVVTSWRQGTELSLFCWWNLKKKNQTLSEDKMRIFWKQEKCLHSHLRSDKSSRKFRDIIVKTWWHPLKRTTLTEKSLRKICASINHLNANTAFFLRKYFSWSGLLVSVALCNSTHLCLSVTHAGNYETANYC